MTITDLLHSLLYMVFVAIILTVGLSVIFGRKPDFHETLALLFLGWIACFVAARLLVWLTGRAPSGPIPETGSLERRI